MQGRPHLSRRRPPAALVVATLALSCGSGDDSDGPERIDVGRSDLVALDVGTFRVSPTNGEGVDVEFDVDSSVLSTVVVAAPAGERVTVIATELRDPAGERLLQIDTSTIDAVLPSLYASSVRAYPFLGPGPFALLYPGSPAHASREGTYLARYKVFGNGAQDVHFFTLQKRRSAGSDEPSGGKLPVTFWFAENDFLDAASAGAGDARAQPFLDALAELRRIYESAGIELGTPSYRDLPADAAQRFSVIEGDEFNEIFSSVDTSVSPGLNYFLVDSIEVSANGGTVVGLANGIPGPPSLPGLPGGGVVVSLITLEGDPTLVGQVMAHEGGHYLGLMHTSERDGTLFDLLDDTPQCAAADYDLDGDDLVEATECASEGGANNLMFWSAEGRPELVTAAQRFVLLRNPMVDTSVATTPAPKSTAAHASRPIATTPGPDLSIRARLLRAFSGYETLPSQHELERLGAPEELVPALVELSRDEVELPHKRVNALASLRFFADVAGVRNELVTRASDPSTPRHLRRTAVRALAAAYGDDSLATLAPLLDNPDADLRGTAVRALSALGSARSRELLERRASVEADPNVRRSLRRALPQR